MADTYTKEELTEIYRKLPEEVRDAIFSPSTTDIFDAIKTKQGLTDAQREAMSVYTGFLMMGVLPPEKYVPTLIEKLGIEREKVASIAQEINRDLFNPIKDVLKEVHSGQNNALPTQIATSALSMPVAPTNVPISTPSAPVAPIGVTAVPEVAPIMTPHVPTQAIPVPPIIPTSQETLSTEGGGTQPHIGSIFEQKLGGEFRLRSDAATYANQASNANTPVVPNKPGV